MRKQRTSWLSRLKNWKIWPPVIILLLGWGFLILRYADPPPPHKLILLTGEPDGAYYAFGQQYREFFAQNGIELELRTTAGSLENIELLAAGQGDIAFVQGGSGQQGKKALESLASLYFEPIWIFHNKSFPLERLTDLKGKRIGIGAPGSGTSLIANLLLDINDIDEHAILVSENMHNQAEALKKGELDAAFFVASPTATVIRELLSVTDIELMNVRRHLAYTQIIPYLTKIDLLEGLLDLKQNIPARDLTMLSTTATAVAKKDLHPRIVELFLKAAEKIHGQPGPIEPETRFPTAKFLEYPLNEDAERYLRSGPSIMASYLPFRVVSLLDRLKILIIPMLTLLLPLMKLAPTAYRWGMGKRIYKWYDVLQAVEEELEKETAPEKFTAGIQQLRTLADEVAKVWVPYTYRKDVYNLRMHIGLVIDDLSKRKEILTSNNQVKN